METDSTIDKEFIENFLDDLKSLEGEDYGAYNKNLYSDKDRVDENNIRSAVRRQTLDYDNPDIKGNQSISTFIPISKPLTRILGKDSHLRGNENAVMNFQKFLELDDIDGIIGDKTLTAAENYVKEDPTLGRFLKYTYNTYVNNPDKGLERAYPEPKQRGNIWNTRSVDFKNRKLYDLHSQVLRGEQNFKPLIADGMTTTVRINGIQNREDGLHYNVPTYDPYNQTVIDLDEEGAYEKVDSLVKKFGGWDKFPSFEDPNAGDNSAKILHNIIELDSNSFNNRKKGGFIDMEEGGLVSDTPYTTIESPLANKTDTTEYDTTQGFYSVNPTPNETREEFESRVSFIPNTQFEPTPQTEIPEGYVNPRSQGFADTTSQRRVRPNAESIIKTSQSNQAETGQDRAVDNLVSTVTGLEIVDSGFKTEAQDREDSLNYKVDNNQILDTFTFSTDKITQESYDNMVESFGQEEVDRMGLEVGGLWHQNLIDHPDIGLDYSVKYDYESGKYITTRTFNYNKPGSVLYYGKSYAVDDIINGFNNGDPAFVKMYNELKSMTGPVDLSKKNVQDIKNTQVTYVDGVVDGPLSVEDVKKKTTTLGGWETDEEFQEFLKDAAGKPEGKDLNIIQRTSNAVEDWWNTEIEIDLPFLKDENGNPLKDSTGKEYTGTWTRGEIIQDVTLGLVAGLATGKAEVGVGVAGAAVANRTIESYKEIFTQAYGQEFASQFAGYAKGALAMTVATLSGAETEDVLLAGAGAAVTEMGAPALGKMMGIKSNPDGSFSKAQTGAGAALIAGAVTALMGGDGRDVALSSATSYLFSLNPVIGGLAMAAQFMLPNLFYGKSSRQTGYTNYDMETGESITFGMPGTKFSEETTGATKAIMEPLQPLMEGIAKDKGVTFKGDITILQTRPQTATQKTGRLSYQIVNKDITGFDQRADYTSELGDLDRNQVYTRTFGSDYEGIVQLQNMIIDDLMWAADNLADENGVVDLSKLLEAKKQEMNKNLQTSLFEGYSSVASLMGDPRGGNYETGGKILDKNTKVLYNSNQAKNYGLVDKEGKAPPSARADDVPMTLKEGDYVLSQPAVALYGEETINRMVQKAANEAGTNLKSGGKVPVNVHNGEYIIPKKLTEYIGSNVLENMNNRGLMSVGDKTNI
jgi:hypothetical protein